MQPSGELNLSCERRALQQCDVYIVEGQRLRTWIECLGPRVLERSWCKALARLPLVDSHRVSGRRRLPPRIRLSKVGTSSLIIAGRKAVGPHIRSPLEGKNQSIVSSMAGIDDSSTHIRTLINHSRRKKLET